MSKIVFKLRYVIVIFGMILFIFNIWSISQIKIADRISKVLKDSHPIQKAFNWGTNELWNKDTTTMGINWGVEP